MKILELNGFKYSRESFEGYTFRAMIKIALVDYEYTFNVYTTDFNMVSVEEVLRDRRPENVTSLKMIYWASKELDDATSEFLDEFLN